MQKEVRTELAHLKRLKAAGVASWNEVKGEKRQQQSVCEMFPVRLVGQADGFLRRRHRALRHHVSIFCHHFFVLIYVCPFCCSHHKPIQSLAKFIFNMYAKNY